MNPYRRIHDVFAHLGMAIALAYFGQTASLVYRIIILPRGYHA